MQKGLIGKKIGMTQVFDEKGAMVPVTVIEAGPCTVVQKKTVENDGYSAVQLGYGDIKPARATKPIKGHFSKAGDIALKKYLREFQLSNAASVKVGDIFKADIFESGEIVDISGTSKGKGTAGVIKRWKFAILKKSHGTGPVARMGGSQGANSDPSRVFKGKKMAGRLGGERITVQNLSVVKVDKDNNLIAVKGSVPGPKGGIVIITDCVKKAHKEGA